jgi:hypothetical protein
MGNESETYNKSIAIDSDDTIPDPKTVALKAITAGDANGEADDETEKELAFQFIRSTREG